MLIIEIMTRPQKCRRIGCAPRANYFKPRGIPLTRLKEVKLSLDGLESIRLADLEELQQVKAALRMKVSRATFGRIVGKARRTIADAIVNGKALNIEGGEIIMAAKRKFQCANCAYNWEVPYGTGRPADCPECRAKNIHRAEQNRGYARCGGAGRGPCAKNHLRKTTISQ